MRSIAEFERQNPANLSGSLLPGNLLKESTQKSAVEAASFKTPSSNPDDPVRVALTAQYCAAEGQSSTSLALIAHALDAAGLTPGSAVVDLILASVEQHGADAGEMAAFIGVMCAEMAARGSPVRRANFFLTCIPGELINFEQTRARQISAAKLWKDPYEDISLRQKE